MIKCLKNILKTLTQKQKGQVVFLECLFVLQGITEVFGFSAIVTFIMLILDMEAATQSRYFQMLQDSLHFINHKDVFIVLSVSLLLVFLVKYISSLLAKYCLSKFVYEKETQIVQQLYCKYIFWPYERFFESSTYGFNKKILSDPRGYCRVLETVLLWFGEMIKAAVILCILLTINWSITLLIAFGGTAAAWLYVTIFVKWSKILGDERDELYKAQIRHLNQSFTGIREIILDGKQAYHASLFGQQVQEYNRAEQTFSVLSDLPWIYFEAIGALGALSLITLILLFMDQPAALLSQISVFALLIVKMIPSIQKTVSTKTVINYYSVPFANVVNEFVVEDKEHCRQPATVETFCTALEKEIILENIWYRYPSSEENVLKDICMRIPHGAFIGISGVSGSGKSTLIDVICGLLQPTAGTIYVDGIDISQNLSQWRQKVAYIPQNVFLFEDTLKHNIAPGIPDEQIDHERLLQAICNAQLENVVAQLPHGLDEQLGERGIRLSGGQCQRIAIARALYKDAQLLILDEATSSLDAQTEQDVLQSLEILKGKITVISVAHREAALKLCDERYIVDKGMVLPYEK